jgi:hypothetical protein
MYLLRTVNNFNKNVQNSTTFTFFKSKHVLNINTYRVIHIRW